MWRIIKISFYTIGIVLSIVFLCISDPGFNSPWIWMFGSLLASAALLVRNLVGDRGLGNIGKPKEEVIVVHTKQTSKGRKVVLVEEGEDDAKSGSSGKSSGGALGAWFILLLLCFNPFIQIFRYTNFCQHKDQVVIERTVCKGLTWSDDGSYYNGKDYLNFSIEVSFKKQEVSHFNAHTLVFKGDKFIGYITTDFYGNSTRTEDNTTYKFFEKETTQTLDFNMSHPTDTSWQGHELFQELYYGNLEDYTFVTNVIYVYFSDGTTVGHYLFLNTDFYYDENGRIYFRDQDKGNKTYYYYDDNGKKHYVKD